MRIALVSYQYAEYCIRLARGLSKYADVLLCLPDIRRQSFGHLLDGSRVEVEWFTKPRLRAVRQQVRVMRQLARRVRAFRPDVLHIQQGQLWLNLLLPMMRGYPLVVTAHDPTVHPGDVPVDRYFELLTHRVFRSADALIVHAEANRQTLQSLLPATHPDIFVIPHLALGDETAGAEIAEDDATVLFFGRIWAYKGLDTLIQAEPLISAQMPEVRIVIAGFGEDMERYRRQMIHPERFVVDNRFIPEQEAVGYFRRASVVVLPYADASQSGVVPMAFTYGKAVIATTVGGLPESIEHGRTGLLIPPRNPQALAEAVLFLLRDRALRRRLGENGREVAHTRWSADTVAEMTFQVYQWVVEQASARMKTPAFGQGRPRFDRAFPEHAGTGKAGKHDGTG